MSSLDLELQDRPDVNQDTIAVHPHRMLCVFSHASSHVLSPHSGTTKHVHQCVTMGQIEALASSEICRNLLIKTGHSILTYEHLENSVATQMHFSLSRLICYKSLAAINK